MDIIDNVNGEKRRQGRIEVICGSMFSGKTEELIRRLRRAKFAKQKVEIFKPAIDVRYSEEEVRQSYKFQFYCEILEQIQKDKEEEKAELRLSIPFIVSLVVFSLFSLAATIGIFFSVYFIFLALPLWVLTYGFYKLNKLSIIIWGILLLILSILGCIALFSGSGKVFAAFVPVGTALLNYLADLLKRS